MAQKTIHSDDIDFEQRVKELLMYRRIMKAEQTGDQTATLTLDNGVVLHIEGNEGCGGCGNGWYYITSLAKCENAITNVVCDARWDEVEEGDVFNIFVFADNEQINLLQVRRLRQRLLWLWLLAYRDRAGCRSIANVSVSRKPN